MTRKQFVSILRVVVTTLIVGFSVYFSIWKVDFAELGRSFQTANYWYALGIVPLVYLSHLVRAHRWSIILETVHGRLRLRDLFEGVIIGYFLNNIIPRSGEIARPYVTSQRDRRTTFSSLLGTIVVERFIDVLSLFLIIAGVLLFDRTLFEGFEEFGINATAMKNLLLPAFVIGVLFILIAPSRFGLRLAEVITRLLPERIRVKLLDVYTKLQKGFGAVRTPRQIGYIIVETALLYFLYMLPLYLMFFAFRSAEGADATMFNAVKILALTALAFAVAPTPGAFGIFHVTARIAVMKFLDFSYADAVAYATITHFVNYASVMLLGGAYLLTGNLSFHELMRARKPDPANP